MGIAFDAGLIAPPHAIAQVAHLVHPTALVARAERSFRCGRHARANKDKGKGNDNGNGNDYDDGEGQRATREGEKNEGFFAALRMTA